ncbi:MAG: hypothetical protein JWM43_2328 [Acidobacteriaceae bacterium]|nr:hypothetical protein [Acidobacteriaceae bacterium]
MISSTFVHSLSYLEIAFCGVALFALLRSESAKKFPSLVALLGTKLVSGLACLTFLAFSGRGLERHLAYKLYFYTYWPSFAIESILSLLVVYSIFKLAMEPLKGLATLGILVFRWAAAISVAMSIGMAVGPSYTSATFLVTVVTHLQQTTSILTLCLLLFVCFAIRPMGLTYKSRIFGVSLGLGVMATFSLLTSAWMSNNSYLYSALNVTNGIAVCLTFFVWSAYFTLPEPKRRMILLPTTSPFLRWNQISMALGDDPGFVAVGGIPPEIFAPAEVEIMRRASVKMTSSRPPVESDLLSRLA